MPSGEAASTGLDADRRDAGTRGPLEEVGPRTPANSDPPVPDPADPGTGGSAVFKTFLSPRGDDVRRSGVYGSNIGLTGRLWRYGTPYGIGGAVVYLQRTPHGQAAWAYIKTTRTAANGNYAFAVTQTGAYDYRTVYAGSPTYRVAISPTRYPVTNQRLTLESIATTNAETGALQVTGYVYPLPPNGLPVYLQRWDSEAGVWHNLSSGRTSSGRVAVSVTRPGSVNAYRLVIPARSPYGPGITSARWFAHYAWRGAFVKGVTLFAGHGAVVLPTAAQNPRRNLAEQHTEANYFTRFRIDPTGCKATRTISSTSSPGSSTSSTATPTPTTRRSMSRSSCCA